MKYLSRITSLVLIAILTVMLIVPATTVEAKAATKRPTYEEYYIDDYGAYFRVRITNTTNRTIVVSQKAKYNALTYKYNGPGNPNKLPYYEDPDDYLSSKCVRRSIIYKPKKAVKILPGKSKWVSYKKITKAYYGFEDMTRVKLTIGYKLGGQKKAFSVWTEIDFDY